MTVHIFKCPKCGTHHEWEKFPPMYCKNCRALFDFRWEPEYPKSDSRILTEGACVESNAEVWQFCKNCGKKFIRTTSFCPDCGIKLNDTNPAMVTEFATSNPEQRTSRIKKEEIFTMYDNNAFRILGIGCNADRKTVRDAQQSSKVRAKLGGPINISDPLGFLNAILRDENSIRNALTQIETPRTRISERLFWFLNINKQDSEALEKLNDGQCEEAVKIWNTSDDLSASINLAILHHAFYLAKDIEAVKTEKWLRVLERWQNLINNEKYWPFLEAIEQQSGFEPLATHEDFNTLKNDFWKHLLKPNLDCMKKARDINLDDILQQHIELIRATNLPARTITEIEYDLFSPLVGKISEELEEIGKAVLANKNSPHSKVEKTVELDRLLDLFKTKTQQKIDRFLKFVGSYSDFSKNIREKTATCLREISISYHNDADAFEISLTVLIEARKYAEGTSLSAKFNEDYSTISQHVKEAQEFEKFAEYRDKIGNSEIKISKTQLSFKNQTYNIQDITGIRYGVYQASVNGIPTSRSYAIWLKCGSNQHPTGSSSGYIPPVDQNVMMIECADATWFGLDKIQNRFNEIVNRLYHLIQVPLINKMIQDFESGRSVYVSSITLDFTGIYKDFNYDPLSKGIISLSSKFLGTKDVVIKEGKHKHLSWDKYRGYDRSDGKIRIFDDKGSWTSLNARDDWNANNLPYFFDYMNKEGNLAKSIEKCISGITAIKDERSEVLKTLDNSLAIDPKNWLTWWQKGRALRNLGRFEEALVAFDRVIEIIPNDPEVWNIKGLTLLELKNEMGALDCFARALAINSQLPHVWYNKGMTFARLQNYPEAVRALDRSLAIKFDQAIKNTRDSIKKLIQ